MSDLLIRSTRRSDSSRLVFRVILSTFAALFWGCAPAIDSPLLLPLLRRGELSRPNHRSLGTNLPWLNDAGTDWVFMDEMRRSSAWITFDENNQATGEEASIDLAADGYPRTLPDAMSGLNFRYVTTVMPHLQSGRYVVLYDGRGQLGYSFGEGSSGTLNTDLSRDGRHVIDTIVGDGTHPDARSAGRGQFSLSIFATGDGSGNDYIRNVRVIRPGMEDRAAAGYFHPAYLADLKHYNTIRYKDWLHTDIDRPAGVAVTAFTPPVRDWMMGDRPPELSDRTYTSDRGVPPELIPELANATGTHAWVNMPVRATDAYVAAFATMMRDRLNAGLNVYVEYSGEIFNESDPYNNSGDWIRRQGFARWENPAITETAAEEYAMRMSWYGMRAGQICAIWKQVWSAAPERIRCVMGGHFGDSNVSEMALSCPHWVADPANTSGANCAANMDTLAVGAYFGIYLAHPDLWNQVRDWMAAPNGIDIAFAELFGGGQTISNDPDLAPAGGTITNFRKSIQSNMSVARSHDLQLISYEGGQHLAGFFGPLPQDIQLFYNRLNRDARMGALYRLLLPEWRAGGGTLFTHFVNVYFHDEFGSFGARQHQFDLGAPKYQAVRGYSRRTPCWWDACANPY